MTPLTAFLVLVVAALSWFVATDPWKVSAGAGVTDFRPLYLAPPTFDTFKNLPRDNESKLQKAEVKWSGEFLGPESLTFDPQGRGPYTGVSDGRVIRYDGPEVGWTTFAYTSKNRSEVCAPKTPVAPNMPYEPICGRPLGLKFHKKTGDLWIADPYFGIMKVGPEGGQAESVVSEIDGIPMMFANDLDFNEDGILYFTDSSTRWHRRHFFLSMLENEGTGRFIKYNPATKETTVLIKDLLFPNGVAVSKDGTFVVISETRIGRLLRYWLKGEKEGMYDTFAMLPGWPDNVRCNEEGDFWVAIHSLRTRVETFLATNPWARKLLVRIPIPTKYVYRFVIGNPRGMIMRLRPDGSVKEILEDSTGAVVKLVSEVEEHKGKLYLGSVLLPQWPSTHSHHLKQSQSELIFHNSSFA